MAECQRGSSDTYLNYACYQRLKPKFESSEPGDWGFENLAKAKEKIKVKHKNYPNEYENFFINIAGYIEQDGIFVEADRIIPCRYINYLLNKKLIKDDMYLSNPNYEILKDFVKEFHRSKSSIRDGEICSSEIQYLEYEEYKKMELLYDLYDKYITLTQQYKPYYYYPCSMLGKMISLYNESIKKHEADDVNFIKKLIELKKLIETNVLPSNPKCQRDITHFSESNIEKRAKEIAEQKKRLREAEEAAEAARKQQQAEAEAARKQQQAEAEAARKQQQAEAEAAQKQKQAEIEAAQEQKQAEIEAAQEQQRILSRQEDEITLVQPQRQALKSLVQGPYEVSGAHRQPELAEGLTWEDAKSNDIDEQLHGPKNVLGTSPGGEEGIMGTMKNAISGFMNEVEPAPILGVSGGMGALFLLFKYTPVGTFFRGGRRINNRIPRTFYGQFAGVPAGYDDFYEGGFGPGPINISYRPELE